MEVKINSVETEKSEEMNGLSVGIRYWLGEVLSRAGPLHNPEA